MRVSPVVILATLAAASPVTLPQSSVVEVEARADVTRNELQDGDSAACPKAILIFARGTIEGGNMGTVGAPLGDALETYYGASNVWVQGVGFPYTASISPNYVNPSGSSTAGIAEGVRLFNLANTKCPNTAIVAGGYSQGAALTAAAISSLTDIVRNQIVGTVLFGYTKNQQNNGSIPNYPQDRLKVYCAVGDEVCDGTLNITPAHLSYGPVAATDAPVFLESKIGSQV